MARRMARRDVRLCPFSSPDKKSRSPFLHAPNLLHRHKQSPPDVHAGNRARIAVTPPALSAPARHGFRLRHAQQFSLNFPIDFALDRTSVLSGIDLALGMRIS